MFGLNCLSPQSNLLGMVRFMSKPPFGFGGFSAPVMDLFPTVLTLFTLLGGENTDLRDQFTAAGWKPDRAPVFFYSRSAFANTRLNSKLFPYYSVSKCFWKYLPAWNCLFWQHFTELSRDVYGEAKRSAWGADVGSLTGCPYARPIIRIRLTYAQRAAHLGFSSNTSHHLGGD